MFDAKHPVTQERKISQPNTDTVLDFSAGLLSTGGDAELLAELIVMFLEIVPAQIDELRKAVETDDAPGVQRVAHNLKGSAAALGARRIRQLATELETMGKRNVLENAESLIASIAEQVDRLGLESQS